MRFRFPSLAALVGLFAKPTEIAHCVANIDRSLADLRVVTERFAADEAHHLAEQTRHAEASVLAAASGQRAKRIVSRLEELLS